MASLLNWLGGQVEGAYAQLNPFDNGADYNSVQRRRKQEAQRQAVQPPQLQRPVAPPPAFNPVKGVGDFANGVAGFGRDLALGTVSTGQKVFNTGVAAATGVMGNLSTDPRFKQAAIDQRKDIFNNQRTITGDHATFFDNYNQAMNTNGDFVGNTVKPALRAAAEVGPYVIPFGKFAGTIPAQIAKSAATNAGFLGAANAGLQYANTGKIDPAQVGQSAVIGGTIGAVIPAANNFVKLAKKVHTTDPNPQAGYMRVGYPNAKDLPETIQNRIIDYRPSRLTAEQVKAQIEANKMTPNNVAAAMNNMGIKPFSQKDIQFMADNIPAFKKNPVMTYNPKAKITTTGYGNKPMEVTAPVFEFKGGGQTLRLNAHNLLPEGTDLSVFKAGEQVDFSPALVKGSNKIPAIVDAKPGVLLKNAPKVKAKPTAAIPAKNSVASTAKTVPPKPAQTPPQSPVRTTASRRTRPAPTSKSNSPVPPPKVPPQSALSTTPRSSAPSDSLVRNIPQKSVAGKATAVTDTPATRAGTLPQSPRKTPQSAISQNRAVSSKALAKTSTPASGQTATKLRTVPQSVSQRQPQPLADRSLSINNTTEVVKTRGFTKSVKASNEVSATVRRQVSGKYNVRSTAKLATEADAYAKGNLKKVTTEVNDTLAKKLGSLSDQEIADSLAVAKRLDGLSKFNESQQIYDRLAQHGTKGGQAIQAFSLLRNRTPEGVKFQMLRQLKKAGVELTPADQKQVATLIDAVRQTKANSEARNRALFNTLDFVSRRLPSNRGDQIINIWRAGLLTAPKTSGGNAVGNLSEAVARETWANPVAVSVDKFFSLFTGKRTKTLGSGRIAGIKEGFQRGTDYMKTGYDTRNISQKFDAPRRINYKNKLVDKYVNGVYRWMGAQDQPFYYGAKAAAAHDLAKADALNLGLKGKQMADYVEQAVSDSNWKPQTFKSSKAVEDYARYAVYQNETLLGTMASGVKNSAGKAGFRWITDFILPFTQVPSSIAMRVIDRTPIGVAREMILQLKRKSFDQRAMAEAIGNGTFGIPVVAAGFALAKAGEITGDYPTDSKEQALWKEQGKQPYSVKVGGKWYSLNYMQPFGTILNIGREVAANKNKGKSDSEAWLIATGSAAKSVSDQSFLKGLNGVISAINDPQRSMSQFAKSTTGSIVPNFIRSFATATDPMQREQKTALDAVQAGIPGLRNNLPEKQGMFGNALAANDTPVNQYLNPLRPSKAKNQTDPLIQELQRLQNNDNGIVTTEFNKNAIKDVVLNDTQVRELNQKINSRVKPAWDKAIADPRYKNLPDEEKNTVLKRIKDNVAKVVKGEYVKAHNLQTSGVYTASRSDPFGTKSVKKTTKKVASTRRRSGGRRGNGVTQGKAVVSLASQLNKIRVPKTASAPASSVKLPQMAKTPLRKYQVRTAKARLSAKSGQKPKTA